MAISKAAAEKLCTKVEFQFVEASFPQDIKDLTIAKITRKLDACKRHLKKWRDLQKKQERELSKTIKSGKKTPIDPVARTKKKVQIFTETIERFQKRIDKLKEKEAKELEAKKKASLKAKKSKKKIPLPPSVMAKKSKSRNQVSAKKQMKGISRKISSHTKAANKRSQARRDSRR